MVWKLPGRMGLGPPRRRLTLRKNQKGFQNAGWETTQLENEIN